MFEDMSGAEIFMGALPILVIFFAGVVIKGRAHAEGRESHVEVWMFIGMLVVIGANYYDKSSRKESRIALNESFKIGEDILCYGFGNTYIVSKKRDWKRYKEDGFSKGDILVDIRRCSVDER